MLDKLKKGIRLLSQVPFLLLWMIVTMLLGVSLLWCYYQIFLFIKNLFILILKLN